MVKLSDLKVKYVLSNEPIAAKDDFVFNNPRPDSHMKDVVCICAWVEDSYVIPLDSDLVLRKYPKAWCKKLTFIEG